MTLAQFLTQFDPVLQAFPGGQKYPMIMLERIHARVQDFGPHQMKLLCELLIDNCEHAPKVAKVIEWAGVVRSKTTDRFAMERPPEEFVRCGFCNDLGIIRIIDRSDKHETLMRCECRTGHASDRPIPMWNHKLNAIYMRSACPLEWFKPSINPQTGFIDKDDLFRKKDYWSAKLKIAQGYWQSFEEEYGAIGGPHDDRTGSETPTSV